MSIVSRLWKAAFVISLLSLSACGGDSGGGSSSDYHAGNNTNGSDAIESVLTAAQLDPGTKSLPTPPSTLDASLRPPISNH